MSLKSEGEAAGRRVDTYLETLARIEPDIAQIDDIATWTSIAISLKRIADALTYMACPGIIVRPKEQK